MKKLLFLTVLFPIITAAQHHVYFSAGIDPNKAFNVIDNPRTEVDHHGLDFNVETGIALQKVKTFIYYGRFEAAGYQEYGAGVDYILPFQKPLELTLGLGYGNLMRVADFYEKTHWMGFLAWNVRTKFTYWFGNFGINAKLQFQQRPDIDMLGIIEGGVGISYRIERKY